MKKHITIKDIAQECGVSIGTVDRIIHQRGRFSAETEEKVNAAMEYLHYVPKSSSTLPNGNRLKIGVSYPLDTAPESFWSDANEGVNLAEQNLKGFGIDIIRECTTSFAIDQQKQSIQNLMDKKVNAIITTAFDNNKEFIFNEIIPETIPFATVVNKPWNSQGLFHLGPNDEAMGALAAKLISLYCPHSAKVVVIAPSIEIEGTHSRIKGFLYKIQTELNNLNILQIAPVLTSSSEDSYQMTAEVTKNLLSTHQDLDALYITNGFVQPVCDMVKSFGRSNIQVFGHERFPNMTDYLSDSTLTATIYQNPKKQWIDAITLMANYLTTHSISSNLINADCYILMPETLSLINF